MDYDATVPLDASLRVALRSYLFEIYHENSKIPLRAVHQYAVNQPGLSEVEQYLMTRGFRQYKPTNSVGLPPVVHSATSLQEIMARRRSSRELTGAVTLSEVATLLEQSLGCTAIVEDGELTHALRAWPSAGGLFPLDAYLIAAGVEDLSPGLYYYNPILQGLERLPSRSPDEIIEDAFFGQSFTRQAALVVLLVAAFERTTAKYGERGYRFVLLDAGHAAQNLLLTAEQMNLRSVAIAGFCDDSLARDLAIDGVSEAVVHTVFFGGRDD